MAESDMKEHRMPRFIGPTETGRGFTTRQPLPMVFEMSVGCWQRGKVSLWPHRLRRVSQKVSYRRLPHTSSGYPCFFTVAVSTSLAPNSCGTVYETA